MYLDNKEYLIVITILVYFIENFLNFLLYQKY